MVSKEQAEKEFQLFVEEMNIKERKLRTLTEIDEQGKSNKTDFIEGIETGNITVDESGFVSVNLDYPIQQGDKIIEKITFKKRRITVEDMNKHVRGKTDTQKAISLTAWLTNCLPTEIERLDGDDFSMLGTVSAFFLPR